MVGWIVSSVAAAGMLVALLPLILVGIVSRPEPQVCVPGPSRQSVVPASTASASGLGKSELSHAAAIIAEGRRRGVSDRGIVIALATALQESGLRVYANDGLGADLAGDQTGIARSLHLPHDAVGTDHGSLGVFQQQWPWWGSMTELMDPATSAALFYQALARVDGWEALPVTVAAQAVQRSAYPNAYADDEPLARRLLDELGDGIVGMATHCAGRSVEGAARFPLPASSTYVDQHNFGTSGQHWSRWHTGTDLSVACGTPVLAATGGKVRVAIDESWAGRWLVHVVTSPGGLTTWYAHMNRVAVTHGAVVRPGQQIGEVGDLGNASGCHLHFEVHPHGGGIYEDPVDPTVWLAEHVGRRLPGGGRRVVARARLGRGPEPDRVLTRLFP